MNLFKCLSLTVILSSSISIAQTADYTENGGSLTMQAEDFKLNSDWKKETSATGYKGTGYIVWKGPEQLNTASKGTINVTIKINTVGVYKFVWRTKVGKGESPTDFNDSWVKFVDVKDYWTEDKSGKKYYPKGSGKTPNPDGASSNGFFKVFSSGTINWTDVMGTFDNQRYPIFINFDKVGVYTMQIAARSDFHLIDEVYLTKQGGIVDPPPPTCGNTTLNAIENFNALTVAGFAPTYKDNQRKAIAVDPIAQGTKWAAAKTNFTGKTGTYDIVLTTLTELDGESSYIVKVGGKEIGTFKNPTTTNDYTPATKKWNNISVKDGDEIQVECQAHTNGNIPEGNGTAFSRGRWTKVEFICQSQLGTDEFNQDESSNLRAYPNPSADGMFNLSKPVDFEVITLTGKVVQSGSGDLVNLSGLSGGIYLLKAKNKVLKLVK